MANLYKRYYKSFAGASTENLLVVPDATAAVVKSIIVSNTTGSSINVTAAYSPLGSGTITVAPTLAVATNTYVDLLAGKIAGPLILEATDILKITSSAANLNVTVSAMLVDRN
jgi:hypothetical protein